MDWLWYIILAVVLVAGLYINLVGAPGLWVMVLATGVYALVTGGRHHSYYPVIVAIVLAGFAELMEFLVAGAGAKKAGASRGGLWGAIIGSIVGAIFFTALLPIPIVGTIFGVCLGTFLGAIAGELFGGTELRNSLRIGIGAAIGRLMAIFTKLLFGCAIMATVLIMTIPWSSHASQPAKSPAGPPATTLPTSAGSRTIALGESSREFPSPGLR